MSRAPRTNIALLTEGQSYIQRAKQARKEQVETVKFDDDARRDWLSGFSKRKKAKTEERRSRAMQREHEAHLEERKKARRELKERAAQNVKAVRKAMGLADDSDVDDDDEDDDMGANAEAGPSRIMPEEVEYEDEDQLATVTIIEDFEPDQVQRFTRTSSQTPEPETEAGQRVEVTRPKVKVMPASSRRATQKAEREKKKREEQKSSRSMETKAERKIGKAMQSKRRTEKAALAIERNGKTKFAAKGKGGKGSFKGKKGGVGGKGKR